MRRWVSRPLLPAAVFLALLAPPLAGQEFRATINGQVSDPSRAAVPGATVTVRNEDTGEAVVTVTNAQGLYAVPFLKPGSYSLAVEMAGFKRMVRGRQRLQVGQTATIDLQLEIGAASEEITITAEALLDLTKADRGNVIDNRQVSTLPLNARNPFMLALATAGVNFNGNPIYQRPFDNGAIADWSINGGQNRNNEFLLDGAPNNSIQGGNNIAYVPPVDSVQEFKIMTNSYDAQYGRTAGGVINVSLKSGTNTLHGTLYEYMRRRALDANTLYANANQLERPDHYLDQYGFQLDGPLVIPNLYNGRSKTFFLVQVEGYREGTPSPTTRSVPPEEFRRGDFRNYRNSAGQLITIYDPRTTRLENGRWVRDPFPDNVIPRERIDPIAERILSYYPLPNTLTPGSEPWRNNYRDFPNLAKDDYYNLVVKLDHVLSARDRFFVRYGHNLRSERRSTNGVVGVAMDGLDPLQRLNHSFVADWVHVAGATAVFNLRFGASRYVESQRAEAGLGFDATELGFPHGLIDQLSVRKFPRIEIGDFISLGRETVLKEPTNTFSLQPNLTMMKGRHNLRLGVDARYTQYSRQDSGNAGMQITFNRALTQRDFDRGDALSGSALASLLLGAPTGGNIDHRVQPLYGFSYAAPWIQDDWKLGRRLTLNLGLRWDFNAPVRERDNRLNYGFFAERVNPVSARIDRKRFPQIGELRGGIGFAGVDGNPETPWRMDWNNLQPRIGLVFELDKRTLLRGGYGRYFMNPTSTGYVNGFSITTPFNGSPDGNRTSFFNLGNPFPNGVRQPPGSALGMETYLGQGIDYANPGFEIPYVYQFSIGVQRQLPWKMVAELSYVGSRSYQIQSSREINETSPAFRDTCNVLKGGDPRNCNEQVANPFYQVPGFEGTSRFENARISRDALARPMPQFGGVSEALRNDGRIWYNSLQAVLNKRFSRGLSFNANYTFAKLLETAEVDSVTRLRVRGPGEFDQRHVLSFSGVLELPFGRERALLSGARGLLGALVSGWELSALSRFMSGQPWELPDNIDYVKDASLADVAVKGVGRIRGVQPCVAEYRDGRFQLYPYSVAAGCTEPNFLRRPPYTDRSNPRFDDRIRRPNTLQLDMSLVKTTRLGERVKLQLRADVFNVTNTATYDRISYSRTLDSPDFGTINKLTQRQSNFPRQIQLAAKLVF